MGHKPNMTRAIICILYAAYIMEYIIRAILYGLYDVIHLIWSISYSPYYTGGILFISILTVEEVFSHVGNHFLFQISNNKKFCPFSASHDQLAPLSHVHT